MYSGRKGGTINIKAKLQPQSKKQEILIYNSYPCRQGTEYPALHILVLQFCYGKSKDKASQGKITITQQINSSNLSLGPRAARFARYRAGKGQPRASVTANRPWSPSRRPQPRTERGAPGALSTKAHVGTTQTSKPATHIHRPLRWARGQPSVPDP